MALIVSLDRNRYLQQHQAQTHAEVVLPTDAPQVGRLRYLWKEFQEHDADGTPIGKRREQAGQVTILRVEGPFDIPELGLDVARGCGYKTAVSLQEAWQARHPRSPRVAVVWFALGDWRDRDLFLNYSGTAGGDYCVDDQTEALTKRGWLSYDQIRDDDELMGYDIASHTTRWERHTGIHVFPAKPRDLIVIRGRSGSIVSTPNHRWPTVVERSRSSPRRCPHCGDILQSTGYPQHAKTCARNRLVARRFIALRSSLAYHAPVCRIVAEEFGVSAQVVQRATRRYRSLSKGTRPMAAGALNVPTQRIKVREQRTTETLGRYARLLNGAPCSSLQSKPVYGDSFVELVAWFCTEGNQKRYRNGQLRKTLGLCQSSSANPENVRAIVRALDDFCPGHWKYGAPPNRRREMKIFLLDQDAAKSILEVAPNKVMAYEFVLALTKYQLELLWHTWERGDGSWNGRSGRYAGVIGQKDRSRLEPLQVALSLLGAGSVLRFREPVKHAYDDRLTAGEWSLRRSRRPVFDQAEAPHEIVTRNGIVWCPTTPSSYWLARRDGRTFLTGNTMNPRRALDADAPVLTREQIDALSSVNRQKDDARRAAVAHALAAETPSQRLLRMQRAVDRIREQLGEEAARYIQKEIRQHVRIIEQRVTRAEKRK